MENLLHRKVTLLQSARMWWREKPQAFDKVFDRKSNAIGFLRTFFALLVIVDHSFHLGGFGADTMERFSHGWISFGGAAVIGFFILSGYLITTSFTYASSVWRYLWNRFLRIMPAFWVALVVVAFGFAPLSYFIQHHTLSGFLIFNANGPIDYIVKNFGLYIHQYSVSGLLGSVPWPNAFNGSLWTLFYEATGYVLIAVFGVFGVLKKNSKLVLPACIALFGLYALNSAIPGLAGNIFPVFKDAQMLPLMMFFFAGAGWYLYQEKIPVSNKYFILSAILFLLSCRYHFYPLLGPITFVYCVFYLAAKFPIKSFDKKADFSYGIYIYAFPIQQVLIQMGATQLGVWLDSLLAAIITIPFAAASYFAIEKPALRLKSARLRIRKRRN